MLKFTKNLTIFLFVLASFFYIKNASASNYETIDNSDQDNLSSYSINGQEWGQRFTAIANNVSGITIWNGGPPGGSTCTDDCTYHIRIYETSAPTIYLFEKEYLSNNAVETQQTFIFDNPVITIAGNQYTIEFISESALGDNFSVQGSTDGNGDYYSGCMTFETYCYGTERDFRFIVWASDSLSLPDTIIPEYPLTGDSPDSPVNFRGTYSNSGLYTFDKLMLLVGRPATTTPEWYFYDEITTGQNISYSYNADMENGDYWYWPILYNSNATSTGTTTLTLSGYDGTGYFPRINFSVGQAGQTSIYDNVMEYCNTEISTSTNPLIRYVVEGFRDVMCVVFIPDRQFIDDLATTSSAFTNQAPIGYVKLTLAAWEKIATTAQATATPAFLASIDEGNTFWNIIKSSLSNSILSFFRIFISILLVIFIPLYIYKRIRKLIKV